MRRLETRIGKDDVLRFISRQTRRQTANQELPVERFVELMREAVKLVPVRRKTRVSRAVKERRPEENAHRGILKNRRSERNFLLDSEMKLSKLFY